MRMRKRRNVLPRMERCQSVWIQTPEELAGAWRSLMPQARELRVEVGCGKGKFTVETAAEEPEVLFVAIERVRDAMVIAMEQAVERKLTNVFFVDMDVDRIHDFFAKDEVDLLYINFCDPWPRSKNAKRRLTYRTFLEKYKYILKLGGQIHFKTDNARLFEFSLEEFAHCHLTVQNLTHNLHEHGPVGIMTGYEEKFYALGTPIHRCAATVTQKADEKPRDPAAAAEQTVEGANMVRE